jgi:hypothetical protein
MEIVLFAAQAQIGRKEAKPTLLTEANTDLVTVVFLLLSAPLEQLSISETDLNRYLSVSET